MALSVHITFNKRWREQIPATLDTEMKALTSENIRDGDTVTYTYRSVFHGQEACLGLLQSTEMADQSEKTVMILL